MPAKDGGEKESMMKKTKRLIGILLIAVMAIAMVFAITACGGNEDEDEGPKHSITGDSFQFTGAYDEVRNYGFGYHFLLILGSDGKATVGQYNSMSFQDYDAAVTSKSFSTTEGTWEKGKDTSGTDCLTVTLDTKKYYAYQGSSGALTLNDFAFSLMGQGSRTINLAGSTTSAYADFKAFVTAKKETAPTVTLPIEVLGESSGGSKFKTKFNADYTMNFYMSYNDAWVELGEDSKPILGSWETDGTTVTITYRTKSTTLKYNAYNASPSFTLDVTVQATYAPSVVFTFDTITHNDLLYSGNYYVSKLVRSTAS